MNEKNYIDLIAQQIKSLYTSASGVLPENHIVLSALQECLNKLKEDTREIPDGFTEDTFNDFLTEQVPVVFPEKGLDNVTATVGDVVGVIPDGKGNYVEVGNADESIQKVRDIIAKNEFYEDEYDDEYEDEYEDENQEVENTISIVYSRLDDNELTIDNVHTIINHPISDALKRLGSIQLMEINHLDEDYEKEAVFAVLEEGPLPLKALALGITSYRGVSIFPGLGQVQAIGSVNFV
jgi:hypothetical protein